MKRVLMEGALIVVIGGFVAFCGNALSPRGISLTKDFFPEHAQKSNPAPDRASPMTNLPTGTNPAPPDLATTLKTEGITLIDATRTSELFNDPRRLQNLIVFVDARDDEHYQKGHIPGALQFDRFHEERFLAAVIPAVQAAQFVVVYCNGGTCEDSHYAALDLGNFIPKDRLLLFGGGITDWIAKGLEVETGERNSGNLRMGQ